MVFYLSLDVPRDPRSIRLPRGNVASRNGAHLFGVCCIIRTGERKRERETRPHRNSLSFFSFFPLAGKRVLEIYCRLPSAGRSNFRICHFSKSPTRNHTSGNIRRTKPFRSKLSVIYFSLSLFLFNGYYSFRNLTSKISVPRLFLFSLVCMEIESNGQGDGRKRS